MRLRSGYQLQNGKYKIIRVLGQGGFGITYLAEHTMLDKYIAIKEFFPKEYCNREDTSSHVTLGSKNAAELVGSLKNKFIKEAKNISKLRHPNIITIHDIFEENSTAYYVMEYIEGDSFSDIIKKSGSIEENKAVGYIIKIADALSYMHSLSMNHLDLKPANIMLRKEDGEPILIDFGLSKQYDSSGGQTSTTPIGISHGYAPIEQYRPGGVATFTPQTDIYALGATLYALLSGKTPPHYSEILEDGLPELSSNISIQTKDALEHAMEIKKNKRPETIQEFIKELGPNKDLSITSIIDDKSLKTTNNSTSINEEIQNNIEDTIILPSQNWNASNENENKKLYQIKLDLLKKGPQPILKDGFEFIDLGLSVCWANMNIGAKTPRDAGIFFNVKQKKDIQTIENYEKMGFYIPSIENWKELIDKCTWLWVEFDGKNGYRVIGPNGNSIFLALTRDKDSIFYREFGRLFSHESFFNKSKSDSYYFYFANNSYYLSNNGMEYSSPVRLIYKP